jgi:WD40 repeat protein
MNKLVLVTLLTVATLPAFAQQFVVGGIDSRAFPSMSAQVVAFDANGVAIPVAPGEISLTEDAGVPRTLTPTCETKSATPVSIMYCVDVSATTAQSALGQQESGVEAALKSMDSRTDEAGLVTHDQYAQMYVGLTLDHESVTTQLQSLTSGSGSDLSAGLLSRPMGALPQLFNARNKKALVVFTDANDAVNASEIISIARTYRVHIYVIGLGITLSDELKRIADSTGGFAVSNVTKASDAAAFASAAVVLERGALACRVTWTTEVSCFETRQLVFSMAGADSRRIDIPAPAGSRALLESSSTGLTFGDVPVSQSKDLTVTLTARNRAVNISSVAVDNNAFTIVSGGGAGTLAIDASRTLVIRYTAADRSTNYGRVVVNSDACEEVLIYVKAGPKQTDNNVRITAPNGGETLTAGKPATITWTGLLPDDPVRLDLSVDNGQTWAPITESATGLSYSWIPGPATSTTALIRLQSSEFDSASITRMVGHVDPVYGAAFTPDGSMVVTAGHDETVRFWNTAGQELARGTGHTDMVWGVDVDPAGTMAASASLDGTVRFWNITNGALLGVVDLSRQSWSVAFSPDGATLLVGHSGGFTTINTTSFRVDTSILMGSTSVKCARYSRDGQHIVTTEDSTVAVREAVKPFSIERRFTGLDGLAYAAAINTDGSVIAVGGSGQLFRAFDVSTGTERFAIPTTRGSILATEFSADGNRILFAGGDKTAKIVDATNGLVQTILAPHQGLVYGARFDAASERVVTASTDALARVWVVDGSRLFEDKSDATFTIAGQRANPATVTFGTVVVGDGADKIGAIVNNPSGDTVFVRGIALTDGDVTDFSILQDVFPTAIPPQGTLSIPLAFHPTVSGQRSAQITIQTGIEILKSTLRGEGVDPVFSTVSLIDYGRRTANLAVIDSSIRLTLSSSANTVNITSITLDGPQKDQFSIVSGGDPVAVIPGSFHILELRYQPTIAIKAAAWVTITTSTGRTQVIHLYGEGTGSARILPIAPLVIPTEPCSTAPTSATFVVNNSGNTTLTLYTAVVEGADAQYFSLDRVGGPFTFPIDVPPGQDATFRVQFTPLRTGTMDATVVLSSNAQNAEQGRTSVVLVARRDSVGFELSRPEITFTDVPEALTANDTLFILNTGSRSLRWPAGPIDLGDFTILSIRGDVTPPGQRSEVVIQFKGGVAGNTYRASYVFLDSTCGRTDTLQLTAFVNSYIGLTVRINSVDATIGSTITVPISVTNKVNLDRTTVTQLNAVITVNATILQPTGSTPSGTLSQDGTTRSIPVTIPIPQGSDTIATSLTFRTTWGNDSIAAMTFTELTAADTILITSVDGIVRLTDLCDRGGVRLIEFVPGDLALRTAPQPASDNAVMTVGVVERGPVRVELSDISGRIIRTMVDRVLPPGEYLIPIDVSELPTGAYFLIMTTASDRRTSRFEVTK